MKKGLVFVFIAVLSAAFLVTGCSQSTDSGGSSAIQIGGRLVDVEVTTENGLLAALDSPEYQVIAVTGAVVDSSFYANASTDFSVVTEIPAGKTVVLYRSVTPGDQFEVKGTLVVEGNGTLVASASNRVRVTDGKIEVINGTIEVDSVVDIHGQDIQIQILGTGKAYFADGTLKINDPLATLDDVKTAFSWVPKGTLLLPSGGGVTQEVKPSELTQIPTTALRRLTIEDALETATPADTATSITVPAGMTFTTGDPLSSLETLTVAGDLTLSDATLNRLETLTVSSGGALTLSTAAAALNNVTALEVSGSITATTATYDQVTSLVVSSEFDAGAVNFNNLQSLTVKEDGEFTTTGTIGPTAVTDPPGITVEIAAGGSVSVASINRLKTSVIAGALTAGGFTLHETSSTLSAAAGGTINGITFPAETTGGVTLAPDTVTITDGYTVPRNEILAIETGSNLIIPTTKALTFEPFSSASGDGVIIAQGSTNGGTIVIDGVAGYTTTTDGVAGDNFRPAVAALVADTAKLTNSVNLDTFYVDGPAKPYLGIGSVTITAVTVTSLASPTLNANTTLDLTGNVVTIIGTNVADVTSATVSVSGVNIQVTDTSWASSTAKLVILNVAPAVDTKLSNNGLINATNVPNFSIGMTTSRS